MRNKKQEGYTTKLKKDDLALVLRPTFKKNLWTGSIDLSLVIMPNKKLKEEDQKSLNDCMQSLLTCFHLLNTDQNSHKW